MMTSYNHKLYKVEHQPHYFNHHSYELFNMELRSDWDKTQLTQLSFTTYHEVIKPIIGAITMHWTKNSGTSKRDKQYESVLSKIRKLLNFGNINHSTENFERKHPMERNFLERNCQKFGYTSRGRPLFAKFRKMLFHSLLEISGNSTRNF